VRLPQTRAAGEPFHPVFTIVPDVWCHLGNNFGFCEVLLIWTRNQLPLLVYFCRCSVIHDLSELVAAYPKA
jgi:hypothetical protein